MLNEGPVYSVIMLGTAVKLTKVTVFLTSHTTLEKATTEATATTTTTRRSKAAATAAAAAAAETSGSNSSLAEYSRRFLHESPLTSGTCHEQRGTGLFRKTAKTQGQHTMTTSTATTAASAASAATNSSSTNSNST